MNPLFHILFQQNRYLVNQLNAVLKKHGLFNAQWTLLFLLNQNGPMTLTAIWKYLNVEAPTVTRTVTRLETLGWVERRQGSGVDLGAIESSNVNPIQPSKEGIIYVNVNGKSEGTGSSWEDATSLLQLAVNTASAQKAKVYVAAGTYKGDTTAKSAFTMVEGVEVYGGFAGTENSLSERDIKKNRTILTGQDVQRVLFQPNDFTDSTIA